MSKNNERCGPLAFVGNGDWSKSANFYKAFLELSGNEVVILPTGAAYEDPGVHIDRAISFFTSLGGSVQPVNVLSRSDAEDEALAAVVRDAAFICLVGESSLHIRAVLKESAVFHAIRHSWHKGAAVVGVSGGAVVLTDPMVDARGGALTVGLGLLSDVAVTLTSDETISAQLRRTLSLAPEGCPVVALGNEAALIRASDGTWTTEGDGQTAVYLGGEVTDLSALAGKPVS